MRTVRDWFQDTAGGLPRTFWYLWTGTLINRVGSFVIIFLAIYLTEVRGFDELQAGLVLGLWGAGGAAGTLTGGVLADRWGRRPTLLTAHLGAATMMLALGFARDLWMVALGALLLGMFAEAARPAFSAMMIDVVPERDRLRAFTLNYWAINLGFACAAALAGLAAEAGYLLLFVVDAATTLATAAVIFLKVGETRSVRAGRHPQARPETPLAAPHRGGLRTALTDRVFIGFVGLNILLALVFMQHVSMLPIAMSQDGLSPSTFGAVIAVNGVLIVAGQLFVPRLIRGRSRSHVLALAALIVGVGFGLTAFADAAWFYALTVIVWTLGEMLNSPSNSTLIAELSPSALRGRYQGVFSLSWSVATFAAPISGGFVRERLGDSALWFGCAAIAGVAALAHLFSGPARERRAAELRTPPAGPALASTALTSTALTSTGAGSGSPGTGTAAAT
ncbi:MDR family MFS transporter [Plantactinospora soyae]|uniref:MFS family arabinose efflux permease n=1 Tax=Plantactinospora soyae TaxID=1544732 RepID=A0A927M320_9ACTN|nr:MFS transporter [Plantactinospora soyae]MBE1486739.1 putative MFS family arabinose efflux permease [Plantactinospora soyae]